MGDKFVMENKNIEKQISPDEIDAKIHQIILTEERFLKWNIGAAVVFGLMFLAVVVVGVIFKRNIGIIIFFGIITAICFITAFASADDYRNIKKQKYPCYICKIESFIDHQYLRVNSGVKAVYNKEDFRDCLLYTSPSPRDS